MKTIKKVTVKAEFVETVPKELKQGVIYISEKYNTSVHACLCGCLCEVVLPLGDKGWNCTLKNGKVSFTPSVGNYQQPCKSHYIITNDVANFV